MPDLVHSVWHALDLTRWQFIAAVLATLAGGVISGITGFGFGLVIVPVFLLLFPPASVVVLSKGLGVGSGLPILANDWRMIRWRLIAVMFPPAVIGLVLGTWILTHANSAGIKLIAGIAVVAFAVVIGRGFIIPGLNSRYAPLIAGFLSGTLGTSTGMPGPPAVIYLSERGLTPRVFRVTIVAYFFAVDLLGIVLVVSTGKIDWPVLWIFLVLLPFALIGRVIGQHFLERVNREQFRRLTLNLLILTGASAVITALAAIR